MRKSSAMIDRTNQFCVPRIELHFFVQSTQVKTLVAINNDNHRDTFLVFELYI